MTESEYIRVQREEKRKWWIKFQRDSSIEREERPERWLGAQWDGAPTFSPPEDILPSSAHEPWVERDIVDLLFKEPINPPMLSGPRSAVGGGDDKGEESIKFQISMLWNTKTKKYQTDKDKQALNLQKSACLSSGSANPPQQFGVSR